MGKLADKRKLQAGLSMKEKARLREIDDLVKAIAANERKLKREHRAAEVDDEIHRDKILSINIKLAAQKVRLELRRKQGQQ